MLYDALISLTFKSNGYTGVFASATGGGIQINNSDHSCDTNVTECDAFFATAYSSSLTGPPVAGLPLWRFEVAMYDPDGTAFATAETLPPTINVRDFEYGLFQIVFGTGLADSSAVVVGDLIVPDLSEPNALALMSVGIVFLIIYLGHRRLDLSNP